MTRFQLPLLPVIYSFLVAGCCQCLMAETVDETVSIQSIMNECTVNQISVPDAGMVGKRLEPDVQPTDKASIPLEVCLVSEQVPDAAFAADQQQEVCWSYSNTTFDHKDNHRELITYRQQQGLVSFFLSSFLIIRVATGNRNLSPLVNAIVTGPAGVYLYASQNETLSNIMAGEPATDYSLENTLPLLFYGYAGYEILDSLHAREWQHILHGIVIFSGCAASHNVGKVRIVVYSMFVEMSQIFFNAGFIHKRHYNLAKPSPWFYIPFFGFFFASRWVVLPYEYVRFIRDSYLNQANYQQAPLLNNVVAAGVGVALLLNFYWGVLSVYKVNKMLSQ